MKLEGEYAVDKWQRVHRIVSGVIYLGLVSAVGFYGNLASAFRLAAACLLPLACIWFADRLADFQGNILRSEITMPSPEPCLRWGGWFALLVICGVITAVMWK